MAKKGTITTSDYIPFDRALNVGQSLLKNEGTKNFGLLIIVAVNSGLRIGDILKLRWEDLRSESIRITEEKTNKNKVIKFNDHIKAAVRKFSNQSGPVFMSQKNTVYSRQAINRLLKIAFKKESRTLNISSHSLRKAFGRALYERNGESEKVLLYLSELYNHTSPAITRKYLGIRQEVLNELYDSLV